MAATKTIWWDESGKQHDGWIENGMTFTDDALTTRVPEGATVQTAGGTYKMTSNGGVPTYATAKNQYEQKSNAAINAYQAAGQVQEERINSATQAAIEEINRQKGLVEQNRADADKAAREAYEKAANPFGALEEQRVRLGLDESGYSESSKLKLASAYAAQQNKNLRAMNEQLRTLDVQIAQAKANGQYELANMLEARAQNVMQQQIALQGNLFSGEMQAIGQAESTRQFNAQMAAQKEQAEQNNKYNLATTFLEAGISAPFVSETLGIPQADVNAMASAIQAQLKAKYTSSGGGKKVNTEYIQNIANAIKASGLTYDEWWKEYGSAYALNADEKQALASMFMGYNPLNASGNKQTSAYQQALNVIGGMKRRGTASKEAITAYINSLPEGSLSMDELDSLIEEYKL